MLDLVDACERAIGRDTAVKGVRNICRYFGGGQYYLPKEKKDGVTMTTMHKTLCQSVGEQGANVIIDKIMTLFGGGQFYIPLEIGAFEDVIAEEIYRRAQYENTPLRAMFRDYNVCFPKIYRLWKKGRKIKLSKERKK
jgi:Mor family transcriptional regulator